MIFKSKSSTNLPSTNQHNICTKSTTTLAHFPVEQPDDALTALPPPPPPPPPPVPAVVRPTRRLQKKQNLTVPPPQLQESAEKPDELPQLTLGQPESKHIDDAIPEDDAKKKESVWRRLLEALKKRLRKEKESGSEAKARQMIISGPTDFQHLRSGIACLPGRPVPQKDDTEVDNPDDWETVRPSESVHG